MRRNCLQPSCPYDSAGSASTLRELTPFLCLVLVIITFSPLVRHLNGSFCTLWAADFAYQSPKFLVWEFPWAKRASPLWRVGGLYWQGDSGVVGTEWLGCPAEPFCGMRPTYGPLIVDARLRELVAAGASDSGPSQIRSGVCCRSSEGSGETYDCSHKACWD